METHGTRDECEELELRCTDMHTEHTHRIQARAQKSNYCEKVEEGKEEAGEEETTLNDCIRAHTCQIVKSGIQIKHTAAQRGDIASRARREWARSTERARRRPRRSSRAPVADSGQQESELNYSAQSGFGGFICTVRCTEPIRALPRHQERWYSFIHSQSAAVTCTLCFVHHLSAP